MSNDKDNKGRFVKGNKAAKGHRNPNAAKVQQIYQALVKAVSVSDIRAIMKVLVKNAREGDLYCAREILNRLLGKPAQTIIEQSVEDIPKLVASPLPIDKIPHEPDGEPDNESHNGSVKKIEDTKKNTFNRHGDGESDENKLF